MNTYRFKWKMFHICDSAYLMTALQSVSFHFLFSRNFPCRIGKFLFGVFRGNGWDLKIACFVMFWNVSVIMQFLFEDPSWIHNFAQSGGSFGVKKNVHTQYFTFSPLLCSIYCVLDFYIEKKWKKSDFEVLNWIFSMLSLS